MIVNQPSEMRNLLAQRSGEYEMGHLEIAKMAEQWGWKIEEKPNDRYKLSLPDLTQRSRTVAEETYKRLVKLKELEDKQKSLRASN